MRPTRFRSLTILSYRKIFVFQEISNLTAAVKLSFTSFNPSAFERLPGRLFCVDLIKWVSNIYSFLFTKTVEKKNNKCPSIRPSVRTYVRPSVRPSVHKKLLQFQRL